MAQIFPIDFEEKLTMAQDDYILFSDSEDGNKIKKAQYKNLKGEKGDTGARINSASFSGNDIVFGETDGNSVTLANAKTTLTGPKGEDGADGQDGAAATITVGTTTTGDAGTSASVTNSGTSSAAVLNFTIPKGDKGDTGSTGSAATITVGTTTTGDAGTSASVTNSGTSSAAVLDFTIPKGDKGDTGNTGATGNGIASVTSSKVGKTTTVTITETNGNSDSFEIEDGADGTGSGDVNGPASSTDSHVVLFDGTTGKLIKDSGKTLSEYVTVETDQDVNSNKTIKGVLKVQNGQGTGSLWVGGDVNANTLRNNQRHLARISVPSYSDITLGATLLGFDTSGDSDMHVTNKTYDTVSFGGMKKITNATSPMAIGFCVASERNGTASGKKVYPLELDANEARFNVQPNYNGTNLATISDIPTVPTNISSFNNDSGYLTSSTGVTTVNGSHGAVTVNGFNPGGTATTGYVVTKTADGYEWAAPSGGGGDVMVSTQANNILTTGMKIWAGTQANYEALGTYDNQTVYLII